MTELPELFYDIETFWAQGYSLSSMNVFEYMDDPRFQFTSMTAMLDGKIYQSWGDAQTRRLIDRLPWSKVRAIAHNGNEFDHLVMRWKCGKVAAAYGDTLCMARQFHNRVGLGLLVEHYGIGKKDNAILLATKGKRAKDFSEGEARAMLKYNAEDTGQLKILYGILRGMTSDREMDVIDMTAKMSCDPGLMADRELLAQTLYRVQEEKEAQLRSLFPILGTDSLEDTKKALMSAAKFGKALEALGVEVPMKESPSVPGKFVPALAKTDAAFIALQDHPDERIGAMVAARLGAKSTLLETRLETMLHVSKVTGGWLPTCLAYYGADQTGRYSGRVWNSQNLSRVDPKKPKLTDALRRAMIAPPGKLVVVRDLSGIELRTNMTLSGQWDQVDLLAAGEDLYCHFAGKHLYHRDVVKEDKFERSVGKIAHLSLGYGSGPATFANMCRIQGVKLDMTPESIVKAYRDAMPQVKGMWKKAQDAIPSMLLDGGAEIDELGMITTVHEGIRLPSGRILRYPNLRQEVEENPEPGKRAKREWLCDGSKSIKRLYGGLLVENCLSADAAVVTDSGVKRITEVTLADRLWDGVEFVNHRGLLYKGVQQTLPVGGVYMTPDHRVLTRRGWVEAREVTHAEAALESERLNRKAFRPPAGTWVRLFQRWKNVVGGAMRLREPDCEGGSCHGERGRSVLRLLAYGGVAQPKIARHEQAPGIRRVAQHVRPVSSPDASSMEELRGPRYYCVRSVEYLRALLGGHGSYVPARIDAGPARQRKGVLRRELPVGSLHRASSEQKELDTGGYAGGTENHSGVSAAVQYARKYGAIPVSRRSPVARDSVTTERREEPVFDLIDAGPRNRFAVVCPAGGTIIVHNCNQAVARDVITDHALEIHRDIGAVRHVVHDEIVLTMDADAAKEALVEMGRVMSRPLDYWPELPLASEGDIAERYGDAK